MRRHRIGLKGPFPIKDFTSIAVVSYFRDHQGLVSISSKGYELLVREIYQQMLGPSAERSRATQRSKSRVVPPVIRLMSVGNFGSGSYPQSSRPS